MKQEPTETPHSGVAGIPALQDREDVKSIVDAMTTERSRRVSDAAIRVTVKRSTRASARLENRTVPAEFKRSAKAERFAIAIEARHKRA